MHAQVALWARCGHGVGVEAAFWTWLACVQSRSQLGFITIVAYAPPVVPTLCFIYSGDAAGMLLVGLGRVVHLVMSNKQLTPVFLGTHHKGDPSMLVMQSYMAGRR